MINWIVNHLGETGLMLAAILIILSLGAMAFAAYQYIILRRSEVNQKRFENYHQLIDWLVSGRIQGNIKLDNQMACVYELRNFKTYKDVSMRILEGLKVNWSKIPVDPRLLNEIDLTLKALQE
jgi:hypothetical protein